MHDFRNPCLLVSSVQACVHQGYRKRKKVALLLITAAKQQVIKTNITLLFCWLQLENYKQDPCVIDSVLRETFSSVTLQCYKPQGQ